MKRLLIILPLAVLLCGILTGWLGGSGMERHLEKQLGIDLPAGAAITYEDSHGGFHGDGCSQLWWSVQIPIRRRG